MLDRLFELCRQYGNLGWSVQEQLHQLQQGVDPSELNSNALAKINVFLDTVFIFFENIGEYETYQELEDISDLEARIQEHLPV